MPNQDVLPTPPLVDNPHAPEIFTVEPVGFFLLNNVVTITFATAHASHQPGPVQMDRIVNARLVLPARGAQALAAGLYDFLKSRGLDPVPKAPDELVQ